MTDHPTALTPHETAPHAGPAGAPQCIARVRLRQHGPIELFQCEPAGLTVGGLCIVGFDRGQDFGRLLAIAVDLPAELPERQRVIRSCESTDLRRIEQNAKDAHSHIAACKHEIATHNLPMKVVDAEFAFDRGKIVFYFAAEERVDFRELVRDLARSLKMRIELRQIGIRDETKILGGIGCCGRATCCASWLQEFSPVNVRMAKLQQLQLNPTKLSGVCNRLKCCLAYEYDLYRALNDSLPTRGQRVRTSKGAADVLDVALLAQEVTVRFDDGAIQTFPAKDMTVVSRTKTRAKARVKRRRAQQPGPPPAPGQQPLPADEEDNEEDDNEVAGEP